MNRYKMIEAKLHGNGSVLSEEEAFLLMVEAGVKGRLQYSTVYNLTTGQVYVFTGGDVSNAE